jgi:arginyl-tRNA synthetase
MIKKTLSNLIKKAIKKLQKEKTFPKFVIPEIKIEYPEISAHGDYTSNIALKIAGIIKKNPIQVGELIVNSLPKTTTNLLFEKAEVINPGFINFFFSESFLLEGLKRILKEKKNYGSGNIGKGKKIVIDYSAPNIAKPFGIGHLRSTIIGQAIYNLYQFLGYKVIGDNHLGDWGTQFGKLLCAIKKWGDEKKIAKDPICELNILYVKFHKEAEKDSNLEEEARLWFKKLEKGDKEAKRIWKKCVKWSLKEFDRIYKLLGIKIDIALGESFYQSKLKGIVKKALDKKIAIHSRGAIIIPFPKDILPPLMIQKSDGATLYSTRDLATIKYRLEKFKPTKIIYEIGADQVLYLKQLFFAAELLGLGERKDYFHVSHGMMRLASGKMRTRAGNTIFLEEVLKEAIKKSLKVLDEKKSKLSKKEKEKTAKVIGIGAVKYNDLSHHYSKDIIFDWKKILNLKGNSGPYLQYTFARACSVLRKSKIKKQEISKLKELNLKEVQEIKLLKQLLHFPEIIENAAENYSPNLLSNYLFKLAQSFNLFYELVPILKAKDEKTKKARLALVFATSQVLKNGLKLLGIETLEKM